MKFRFVINGFIMTDIIHSQYNLDLPFIERIEQKLNNAVCLYCNHERQKEAYDYFIHIHCEQCRQQYHVYTGATFERHLNYSKIHCISLYNQDWRYYLNLNPMVYVNSLTHLPTQQSYFLPDTLIISPENFNNIDNILLLL